MHDLHMHAHTQKAADNYPVLKTLEVHLPYPGLLAELL